jgi:hypothetical protein
MRRNTQQLRHKHESVLYVLGALLPVISAVSLLDTFGLSRWAWALLLWLSCGHYSIYYYGLYPNRIKYSGFGKGLFVFGVGAMWPVWCVAQRRKKKICR